MSDQRSIVHLFSPPIVHDTEKNFCEICLISDN